MNIQVGQIWNRIDPLIGEKFYGWKVKILEIAGEVVTYQMVEYNGNHHRTELKTSLFVDDFLAMYELEEG